jgi:beta-lactamase superfamily II metal-dependent hydrolase
MSRLIVRAFVLVFFVACATAHRDPGWSAADEAHLAKFKEVAAREAAAPRHAKATPPQRFDAALASVPTGPLLDIYVFSLGQADSMLVVGPGPEKRTLLIDLGQPNGGTRPRGVTDSASHVLKRITEITRSPNVDYFVLTHYHGDHAGSGARETGIIGLLSNFDTEFSVGEFIHVGDENAMFAADENERSVFKTIKNRMDGWIDAGRVGVSVAPQFGTGQIDLGPGVSVEILAFAGKASNTPPSAFDRVVNAGHPYNNAPANENDYSIAMEIKAGEFEMFTGGDLNGTDDPNARPLFVPRSFGNGKQETYTNVEHHLVRFWTDTGRNSEVEVYRADHHGSQYSNTLRLLNALKPEFVLYSCGAQYNHPEVATITRAGNARQLATTAVANSTAFRNAGGKVVGEIHIEVEQDGQHYKVQGDEQTAHPR